MHFAVSLFLSVAVAGGPELRLSVEGLCRDTGNPTCAVTGGTADLVVRFSATIENFGDDYAIGHAGSYAGCDGQSPCKAGAVTYRLEDSNGAVTTRPACLTDATECPEPRTFVSCTDAAPGSQGISGGCFAALPAECDQAGADGVPEATPLVLVATVAGVAGGPVTPVAALPLNTTYQALPRCPASPAAAAGVVSGILLLCCCCACLCWCVFGSAAAAAGRAARPPPPAPAAKKNAAREELSTRTVLRF